MKLPGDYQRVAAVVSLPAKDHDPLPGERGKPDGHEFYNAMTGVLHQDWAGDTALDGGAVHLSHFGGGEDLHAGSLWAISMVISSCNSGDPVQWTTASMERAIISP